MKLKNYVTSCFTEYKKKDYFLKKTYFEKPMNFISDIKKFFSLYINLHISCKEKKAFNALEHFRKHI